eukprot:CAMPEP_0117654876 /NCGR_PEP_ID=MMETSP0804-20121206/3981_1 /TAXON_ID=1074897 /ORGANISM="Tetraselmis astigmatica, Strain CCMP880" /LENGTH=407 /DNA_ID=CAMNT_0005461193 /DNA_START=21 /DNA_END=1244 /DNA_ORIENTATION=-
MSGSDASAATGVCNHCGSVATMRCSACQQVSYCTRAHQQTDWKSHKPACLYYRNNKVAAKEVDLIPKNEYVGTLRWGPATKFMPLPPREKGAAVPLTGWQDYFGERLDKQSQNDEGKVVLEPPLIDGLSFPLSFLWVLKQLLLTKSIEPDSILCRKHIVIGAVGASERAEERILADTNYWAEIGHTFPGSTIELWLVGPEVSAAKHDKSEKVADNMIVHCLRGTTGKFLDVCEGKQPIIVGFNTGFGSGDEALKISWTVDLKRILQLGLLAIFTCANDHSDLKFERQLLEQSLKAAYVLYPRRSPFSAVTTTHAPGRQKDTWACANSFVYAIKGTNAIKVEDNAHIRVGHVSCPGLHAPVRSDGQQQQNASDAPGKLPQKSHSKDPSDEAAALQAAEVVDYDMEELD